MNRLCAQCTAPVRKGRSGPQCDAPRAAHDADCLINRMAAILPADVPFMACRRDHRSQRNAGMAASLARSSVLV